MNVGLAVRERILQLCQERHITINNLSTICGITQSTLNNIMNYGSSNPTISTIKKVCDGLELTLSSFSDSPLFENLDQEIK